MASNGVGGGHAAWSLGAREDHNRSGVWATHPAPETSSSAATTANGGVGPLLGAPLLGPPLLGEAPTMQAMDALAFQTARMQLGGGGGSGAHAA